LNWNLTNSEEKNQSFS